MSTKRLILAFLVAIQAVLGQEIRPLVDRLSPYDADNPILYQAVETKAEDPSLGERQKRVTVYPSPVWYADPLTGELKPILIEATRKTDPEKAEQGFAVEANTIRFMVTEAGDAIYTIGEHALRVWLVAQQAAGDVDPLPETADVIAERPDTLTKEGYGKIGMTGVLPDTKIEHVVEPGQIKEYLRITKSPNAKDAKVIRYTWGWDSELVPRLDGETVRWEVGGFTVMVFPAPVAFDADGTSLSARYEIDEENRVFSVVLDAGEMLSRAYPVTIDPTVQTEQSNCSANVMLYKDLALDERGKLLIRFTVPKLWGYATIDEAYVWLQQIGVSGSSFLINIYAQDVGAWTESSSVATLDALSFSDGATDTAQTGTTGGNWHAYDILGDANKGVVHEYAASNPPNSLSVLLHDTSCAAPDAKSSAGLYIGYQNTWVQFALRGDASYFPRITITYTEHDSVTSNATSGFYISQNCSIGDDGYWEPGYVQFDKIFMLFQGWPDLSGRTIQGARFEGNCMGTYSGGLTASFYLEPGSWTWTESSSVATLDALNVGSSEGTIALTSTGWKYLDLATCISSIYAADSTPGDCTVMLAGPAYTADGKGLILSLGDESDGFAPHTALYPRSHANYPRITIWHSVSGGSSVGHGVGIGATFGP